MFNYYEFIPYVWRLTNCNVKDSPRIFCKQSKIDNKTSNSFTKLEFWQKYNLYMYEVQKNRTDSLGEASNKAKQGPERAHQCQDSLGEASIKA